MTTFDQELTDRPDPEVRRVARALSVRDNTIRALHNADKKLGIDPANIGSLGEPVDAAEVHPEHIPKDVATDPSRPRPPKEEIPA